MAHYRHVKICIRSRCQGNELEICNLFQFIILSHKPWLNAIVDSCSQLKLKRWSWKWKTFFMMDVVALMAKTCSRQFSEALILENLHNCMELSHGHSGQHPTIYLSGSLWRKTKAKSSECFYFSIQTNFFGNVSLVVWNKLFSISPAKRPLWRQWNIAESSWKSRTTSTQRHITKLRTLKRWLNLLAVFSVITYKYNYLYVLRSRI